MYSLFAPAAPFAPDAHGVPLPDAVIRGAQRQDLCRTGALLAEREGGDPAEWTAQHERRFDGGR